MKAIACLLIKSLQGHKQIIILIYRWTYIWTEKQCEQLWYDIVIAVKNQDAPLHFIDYIVCVERRLYSTSGVSQLLVIDCQQRLTTTALLFAALVKKLTERKFNYKIITQKMWNYYLINTAEIKTEKRYKLILTQRDGDTLHAFIESKQIPEKNSEHTVNDFEYFVYKIKKTGIDLYMLYSEIGKMFIVYIVLDATRGKSHLIFESLHSIGLELSQAVLIRKC